MKWPTMGEMRLWIHSSQNKSEIFRVRDEYKLLGMGPRDALQRAWWEFGACGIKDAYREELRAALAEDPPAWFAEDDAVPPEAKAEFEPVTKPSPRARQYVAVKEETSPPRVNPNAASAKYRKDRFRGKKESPAETIDWVASHIIIDDVEPEDAPGPTAMALLRWVQAGMTNQSEFWRNIYPKRLPNTRMFEAEQRAIDDGRRLVDIEELCIREYDAVRSDVPEGSKGESAVSTADSGSGVERSEDPA